MWCEYVVAYYCYIVSFCFNDPAATEVYTYVHPLARHDALPISAARNRSAGGEAAEEGPLEPVERRPRPLLVGHRDIIAERDEARKYPRRHLRRALRSEEQTSELQSLMRNSYAVFCLKKKTTLQTSTTS